MSQLLNPPLHEALQRFPGGVRISNQGQRRIVRYMPDPNNPSRLRSECDQRGEQYRINCPFCGDQRHRLAVSYQFGQYDPVLKRVNYDLWFCQNDTNCHKDPALRAQFRSLVAVPSRRQRRRGDRSPEVDESAATVTSSSPIELPPASTPVDQLPDDHPAVAYLHERGFDPVELSRQWDVRFAPIWSGSPASNRIIIPVERYQLQFAPDVDQVDRVLAGWQARQIVDSESSGPKYLFPRSFAKSKVLYGLCQARHTSGPALVVEGPTDVWRAGAGAVATFGKYVSRDQRLLLRHHFTGRPLVILPDSDARQDAVQFAHDLQSMRAFDAGDNRVLVATLPPGRQDPGECAREEIWLAVAAALGEPSDTALQEARS